jgi:hypothetical protein
VDVQPTIWAQVLAGMNLGSHLTMGASSTVFLEGLAYW